MKKIELQSRIDNLTIIEKLVDEISLTSTFNSDIYANILVGVSEAVNNAIVHGNKCDPNKMVQIEYSTFSNSILFKVTDEGNGFDYYTISDPTLPDNIENESGRGIFLMNNLADEVIFNDKGNEVSLRFFI